MGDARVSFQGTTNLPDRCLPGSSRGVRRSLLQMKNENETQIRWVNQPRVDDNLNCSRLLCPRLRLQLQRRRAHMPRSHIHLAWVISRQDPPATFMTSVGRIARQEREKWTRSDEAHRSSTYLQHAMEPWNMRRPSRQSPNFSSPLAASLRQPAQSVP